MNEQEAVRKSLLMCGFIDGGMSYFFQDTDKTVYIPEHMITTFENVIDFVQTFAFYRYCTKEERKIYYHTARRLEKFYDSFKSLPD